MIRSEISNVVILKYADDTCLIGCIVNPLDLSNYFYEINRVANQCADLLLNANEIEEMIFSTQCNKPDSPPLTLNNTEINICDSVKYPGIDTDCELSFEGYAMQIK